MAAAKAGKMVMCEKPLGRNAVEAEAMVAAVEAAGVPNTVWYNYRRVPAVVLIKNLLDEGKFGRIFHYRAKFLQDWTISQELPQGGEGLWRLDVDVAGSGVTGDLLAHNIDTALWLNGPITEVVAMTETFIKERKHNLTGKVQPVGIDDASAVLCRFENGSLAMFEATRYARGHKALYTLEINGEHASAFWDLHDLHRLQYFDHKDEGKVRGWRSVHITDGDHPYHEALVGTGPADRLRAHVHPPIRRSSSQAAAEGESLSPTFREGLATDYVTDAILKSARSRQWETSGAHRSTLKQWMIVMLGVGTVAAQQLGTGTALAIGSCGSGTCTACRSARRSAVEPRRSFGVRVDLRRHHEELGRRHDVLESGERRARWRDDRGEQARRKTRSSSGAAANRPTSS